MGKPWHSDRVNGGKRKESTVRLKTPFNPEGTLVLHHV